MAARKPCPVCGQRDYQRKPEMPCHDCLEKMRKWDEYTARVNQQKETATVMLKGAYHWYPGFYFGGPHHKLEGFDETRTELHKLFAELGELACTEKLDWKDNRIEGAASLFTRPDVRYPKQKGEPYAKPAQYPTSDGEPSYHDLYGKIDARLLEVIRLLWDHTARFAEMAYLCGIQDGRDILFQLSSGQMSGGDFEERDMDIAKRVQNAEYLHSKLKRSK